jgi:hypothetical protein
MRLCEQRYREAELKIKFGKIAKSLTGFSTPVFGISWNPPETDREAVRKLITYLEDRRALYNPYDIENVMFVDQSILDIRKVLTDTLREVGDDSDISPHLRAMRAACRKYMNEAGDQERQRFRFRDFEALAILGELRAVFGIQIAQLAVKYGVDVEADLASILPVEDEDGRSSKTRRKTG